MQWFEDLSQKSRFKSARNFSGPWQTLCLLRRVSQQCTAYWRTKVSNRNYITTTFINSYSQIQTHRKTHLSALDHRFDIVRMGVYWGVCGGRPRARQVQEREKRPGFGSAQRKVRAETDERAGGCYEEIWRDKRYEWWVR